ncbi:MAG: hypothetical protein U0X20_12070 [Caldilineaceae bacterium]
MGDSDADMQRGLKLLEQAPLGKLVQSIAIAIAEAQYNMDRFAIETLKAFGDREKNGVELPGESGKRSMLELGFVPSFYHFSEATITAKVAFSAMNSEEWGAGAEISGGYPEIFSVSVNASYSNKYSFTADGSSEIRTTIVSLPPPGPLSEILARRTAGSQGTGGAGDKKTGA